MPKVTILYYLYTILYIAGSFLQGENFLVFLERAEPAKVQTAKKNFFIIVRKRRDAWPNARDWGSAKCHFAITVFQNLIKNEVHLQNARR